MRPRPLPALILALATVWIGGGEARAWEPDPESEAQRRATAAVDRFRKQPRTEHYFDNAHGYAVLHSVGRLGFGFGGAYGRGFVVEQDRPIGKTSIWQFTSGIQAGAKYFSMIIFFKDKEALEYYKQGKFEFMGTAGFSLATLGASKDPAYNKGVAIFTRTKFGLMGEAAVAGAKFTYKPLE